MAVTPIKSGYDFLPWQKKIAMDWLAQRERFAHAWLIHGLAGIGKTHFARAAAASLLCEQPVQGLACGRCEACGWVAAGNHPDLRLLRPDSVAQEEGEGEEDAEGAGGEGASAKKAPSREIRAEQIRRLGNWFNTATHRAGWRVAVLYPAEALNHITANALLKILEEPPANTVFLLVADAPDKLLPTIVSRCRRLPLPVPALEATQAWMDAQGVRDADAWLAAAGGAPVLATRLAASRERPCPDWLQQLSALLAQPGQADIGAVADMLEKTAATEWLDGLQRYYFDLQLALAGLPPRYFPALAGDISAIARRAEPVGLSDTAQWLKRQQALATHPLNPKLFIHSALQRVMLSTRA
ncbi:DNA polymerase III subunit delta' [Kerstersia gyiorum]|jgi:DNA polymerase-3 subunit delta'|uniref:DNA polymerase III subunit delta' n=1 Tax=Kerstersia gyiorum TaxID=206506 RepID=UPI00242BC197|nr:DNA polymerase III subunit delta' [Kerstersia gyiorum]MCH4272817.1 DNA polymerase III subunit delta' [Kerstersia gyiorum]MCI1230445.1 DNA polymerase III subunit delta' [Kerstersia gyiorum]